jgi:nucleoside triphosphatase
MSEQVYPEPTVGAIILNKEGKMLLVKSSKWFDKFVIPGGHIELGERMVDAVKREIKEEIGLDIEVIEMLEIQEAVFNPEFAKRKHFIFIDFLAKCKNDNVIVDNDEITDFKWVYPKEALNMNLSWYVKNSLAEYLKKYPK